MQGMSSSHSRRICRASSALNSGRLKSARMTSGAGCRWSRKSCSVSTRSAMGSNPARRSGAKHQVGVGGVVLDDQEAQWRGASSDAPNSRECFGRRSIHEGRLAVEQQPVVSQVLGDFVELFEVDRLHDVAVHPQLVALDDVALFARRREHHHGNQSRSRVAPNLPQHLQCRRPRAVSDRAGSPSGSRSCGRHRRRCRRRTPRPRHRPARRGRCWRYFAF